MVLASIREITPIYCSFMIPLLFFSVLCSDENIKKFSGIQKGEMKGGGCNTLRKEMIEMRIEGREKLSSCSITQSIQ
jgi:hypothetical protein